MPRSKVNMLSTWSWASYPEAWSVSHSLLLSAEIFSQKLPRERLFTNNKGIQMGYFYAKYFWDIGPNQKFRGKSKDRVFWIHTAAKQFNSPHTGALRLEEESAWHISGNFQMDFWFSRQKLLCVIAYWLGTKDWKGTVSVHKSSGFLWKVVIIEHFAAATADVVILARTLHQRWEMW